MCPPSLSHGCRLEPSTMASLGDVPTPLPSSSRSSSRQWTMPVPGTAQQPRPQVPGQSRVLARSLR